MFYFDSVVVLHSTSNFVSQIKSYALNPASFFLYKIGRHRHFCFATEVEISV